MTRLTLLLCDWVELTIAMGIGRSAYEKRGIRCFYKLSPDESKMIQEVWHDIDINLQYHGNGFIT